MDFLLLAIMCPHVPLPLLFSASYTRLAPETRVRSSTAIQPIAQLLRSGVISPSEKKFKKIKKLAQGHSANRGISPQ